MCDIANIKLLCVPADSGRLEVANVVAEDSDRVAEISLCRTEYSVVWRNKTTFYM